MSAAVVVPWVAYGAAVVTLWFCRWAVMEARHAWRMAKIAREGAEEFYELTVEQCKQHSNLRRDLDTRMFARLQAFSETGRVPPERKPD